MILNQKHLTQIEIIKAALQKELGYITDKQAIEWALTFSSEVLNVQHLEYLKTPLEQ